MRSVLRITARANDPAAVTPASATNFELGIPLPCTTTPGVAVGSSCSIDTTLDALVPGSVGEEGTALSFRPRQWKLGTQAPTACSNPDRTGHLTARRSAGRVTSRCSCSKGSLLRSVVAYLVVRL